MLNLLIKVRDGIVELNWLKSGLADVEIVRRERWSTRGYVVIYTALGIEIVHVHKLPLNTNNLSTLNWEGHDVEWNSDVNVRKQQTRRAVQALKD